MSKKKNSLLPLILLSIFCGLVAGVTGEIITRVYFLKDFSVPYFNNEVVLSDLDYNSSNLIIRDAKKVVVNQDVKVSETIAAVRPVLIGIFKDIEKENQENVGDKNISQYYKLDEPDMIGLVVTADGWSTVSVPENLEKDLNITDYVAITSDRKVYKIDQISNFKGLPGNLIFFHLANANNLSVKKITPRTDISLGQAVLVVNDFNNVVLTSISSFQKSGIILSSDSLSSRLSLASELTDNFRNSFVFNLEGNLVGVIGSNKELIPAFAYNYYWQSFLQKGNALQPFLGVNYFDLSFTKPLGISIEKGAWLQNYQDIPAVIKNSPAELAGLRVGDIILWVNNQEINANNDLADVITVFNPGDNVIITYLRDGEEKTVNIELGGYNN